jgi:hypothetical protein
MITKFQIKDSALELQQSAIEWALDTYKGKSNLDYINSDLPILGTSTKVEKGELKGYMTAVVYLQPANKVARKTLCAGAKIFGCEKVCLETSGRLGMTQSERAKSRRTILLLIDPDRFYSLLRRDIEKEHRAHGDKLAIRLNGTSDIDFEKFILSMPHIRFYDYTKIYHRLSTPSPTKSIFRKYPYDLTFSGSAFSSYSMGKTARAIQAGHRVALAFNTAETKGEYKVPSELLDFDKTDLRFIDEHKTGALKAKGTSKQFRNSIENVKSFFFTEKTYQDLENLIASDYPAQLNRG